MREGFGKTCSGSGPAVLMAPMVRICAMRQRTGGPTDYIFPSTSEGLVWVPTSWVCTGEAR